jgi:NADPH:quinone reductase-like Zn-dependent oxidoreductase
MTTAAAVSSTMRALQLDAYGQPPRLVTRPVPRPGPGEVLVRMAAAPINPSDLKFLAGAYGLKKRLPVVPGFEGSGTAVASGGGLMAGLQVGKRVACMAPETGDGTWAEFLVTPAKRCIPLAKHVTLEQGATMVINPWTAWALLETARRDGHRAAVHTAAGGALGRMLARLARRFRYPVIHLVRRAEQAELLRGLGAEHVLDTSQAGFDGALHDLCERLEATVAFDAVAGEMTGRVLTAMPRGSGVLVYGSLSDAACTVRPERFIYEDKWVEGFWLPVWLESKTFLGRARMALGLQKYLATDLATEVAARVPLEGALEAIEQYRRRMSAGKVLILPGEVETQPWAK